MTIRPFLQLLISCFLLMTGYGLSNILLPVRMQSDGVSLDNIGIVLSMLSVGFMGGAIYSRRLLQRVGHIRIFAMCGSLTSVAILLSGLYPEPLVLGGMRIITGFCMACANATLDSWLSHSATEKNRARILSINQMVLMSALFCGQFLLTFAPVREMTLFVISGILLSLAITPIVISKQQGPQIEDSPAMSLMTIIKLSPLGVVSCFYCGILYAGLLNMLPIFAGDNGIKDLHLSIFMGAAIFGAIILQFPIAYLSDHFDRRKIMLAMVLTIILLSLFVPLLITLAMFNLTLLAIAVITGMAACLYPMSMSETFDKVLKEQIVAAMSSLLLIYALGSILGPYIASVAMKLFGSSALFSFMVISASTLLVFILMRMQQRCALPYEEQEDFIMCTPSGAVSKLDPRALYTQPAFAPCAEVEVAVSLATKTPSAAVNMAKALVLRDPDQALNLAAALSTIEEINIGKLYAAITQAAPEMAVRIAEALTNASPEKAEELVDWITTTHPQQFTKIIVAIAHAMPDKGIRVMELAAENIPSELLEMTAQYMSDLSDSLEEMRPVDRSAAACEQTATELYSRLTDISPEHSAELALTVSQALPEASTVIAEAYLQKLIESKNESDCAADATENIENAVSDYLAQVVENMPEYAVDIASSIIASVPDVASEIVELLQDSALTEEPNLSVPIDAKPQQDRLSEQLLEAVETQSGNCRHK